MATVAVWKKRGPKGEAVDFALHFELPAFSPNFRGIERNADHHPFQRRVDALQRGLKIFEAGLVISFLCSGIDSCGYFSFSLSLLLFSSRNSRSFGAASSSRFHCS